MGKRLDLFKSMFTMWSLALGVALGAIGGMVGLIVLVNHCGG